LKCTSGASKLVLYKLVGINLILSVIDSVINIINHNFTSINKKEENKQANKQTKKRLKQQQQQNQQKQQN
jgi:hypothetical protein